MAFCISHLNPPCLFLSRDKKRCTKNKGTFCILSDSISCKDFQDIISLSEVRKKKAIYISKFVEESKKEEVGRLLIKGMSYKDAMKCGRTNDPDEEIDLED